MIRFGTGVDWRDTSFEELGKRLDDMRGELLFNGALKHCRITFDSGFDCIRWPLEHSQRFFVVPFQIRSKDKAGE